MKKYILLLLLLFIPNLSYSADCVLQNYPVSSGDTLTTDLWNDEWDNMKSCVNNRLDEAGGTLTGNLILDNADVRIWDGADLIMYTDGGSTKTISIDGATGEFIGAPQKIGTYNINLTNATTTDTNDTIKIECGNSSCSSSNPGYVVMQAATPGNLVTFIVTSDVSFLLTDLDFNQDGKGDITDAVLSVMALNDGGTLKFAIAWYPRPVYTTSEDSTTQAGTTAPEIIFVNSALSNTSHALEIGWFKADYDDTGGSSENLYTVQTGIGDINIGSSNGVTRPFLSQRSGFTTTIVDTQYFSIMGTTVHMNCRQPATGTSNATTFTTEAPVKSANWENIGHTFHVNNSTVVYGQGSAELTAGSTTITHYRSGNWTASGSKYMVLAGTYDAY